MDKKKYYPKWLAIVVMIPLIFYFFIFGIASITNIIKVIPSDEKIGQFAEFLGALFGLILFFWLSKKNYLYIKNFNK